MKRIRKSAVAAQVVGAGATDSNRQLTFPFAVDRIEVSVHPATGVPLASVAVSLANLNTGTGSFSTPAQNDVVANFSGACVGPVGFDLLTPSNVFKVTSANAAANNVTVYVVGYASADAG